MSSPEDLFDARLSAEPSRPFVTFYDDQSGEWVELSAKSLANWVAKTHFLLLDGLGLGVGDSAFVELPAHWISVPVLLGCWTAGLTIVTDPGAASVAFVAPDSVARAIAVPDVFAIAPASAGRGFGADVPGGAQDYVLAVRPQADKWSAVRLAAADTDAAINGESRASVVTRAAVRATELGLTEKARVLATRTWTGPSDWIDTLLAPLSVSGSVVLVANADPAKQERRIEQEHITSVVA